MACDEAELGPDEYAVRLNSRAKLQEQVLHVESYDKWWLNLKVDISIYKVVIAS